MPLVYLVLLASLFLAGCGERPFPLPPRATLANLKPADPATSTPEPLATPTGKAVASATPTATPDSWDSPSPTPAEPVSPSPAAVGSLKIVALTPDEKSRTLQNSFPDSTEEIFLIFRPNGVKPGSIVRSVWSREGGAPVSDSTSAGRGGEQSLSLRRPPGGWTAGSYTVELSVGTQAAESLTFEIEPRSGVKESPGLKETPRPKETPNE